MGDPNTQSETATRYIEQLDEFVDGHRNERVVDMCLGTKCLLGASVPRIWNATPAQISTPKRLID